MKLFRDLREVERLERKHRREMLLVDIALIIAGLSAGGLILWGALWLTNKIR